MLPLEFVVIGTPVAGQGEAKRFWRNRVAHEARAAIDVDEFATTDLVAFRLAYFYIDEPAADLDNIVKPIQDALKGIVYDDDRQVRDLVASMRRKTDIDIIPSMAPSLVEGLRGQSDFVYVLVDRSAAVEVLR